jgi:hypothetical protein
MRIITFIGKGTMKRDEEFVALQAKIMALTLRRMDDGEAWQDRVMSALVNTLATCIVIRSVGKRSVIAGLIDRVVTDLYDQTADCSNVVEGEAQKRGESYQ